MTTNPQAKGFTTSEFWVTLAGIAASLLVAKGIISQSQVDPFVSLVTSAVTGAGALWVIGVIILQYVTGRQDLKTSLLDAAPAVPETPAEIAAPEGDAPAAA